jgi:hypothetical protein
MMPPVSQAARRFWWWARNNPQAAEHEHGIKPAMAKEFTNADPGGKLPARVHDGKPVKKARKFGSLA